MAMEQALLAGGNVREASLRRWHRSSAKWLHWNPPREGEDAVGRRERWSTGSEVSKWELSEGFRVAGAGAAGGQEGVWSQRLGLC